MEVAKMEKGETKVKVTDGAIRQRINRKLAHEWKGLRKNRRFNDSVLGEYYLIDTQRNCVIDTDVDIESLAADLGVLKGYEKLETD